MMNRGANSDSIPMDLIPEILSRLPAKSISRFRCVSKPWESIICSKDFNDLLRTKSSSSPRLLIVVKQGGKWRFFSSPQPRNHDGESSLVVAAEFHTKFSEDRSEDYFSYASGLFYFPDRWISKQCEVRLIHNPSTGQYAISKEYEELCAICNPTTGQYSILPPDLSTRNMRWREIKCPSIYDPDSSGICINGVLYYKNYNWNYKIGCFDVRSEKFKFLMGYEIRYFQSLINYKGKLCGSKLEYGHDGGFPLKLQMWVLEDVEKEEWSPYVYTLNAENEAIKVNKNLSVVGVAASGEIVLAKTYAIYKPFYVFYFNPETNTFLSVEIQGIMKEGKRIRYHKIYCFVDHVEGLNFDIMTTTYAAKCSRPPGQSTSTSSREDHCTVNKFDARCLSEDD